jgi:hypothetical protein
MNGGKPIALYKLDIISSINNLNKKDIEQVLFTNSLLYKEIFTTPEKNKGFVYFNDEHEMNLGFQAFRNNEGYNIQEPTLQKPFTTRWMDGNE